MAKYSDVKLKKLLTNTYNGTFFEDSKNSIDERQDAKNYIKKVFGDGGKTPDPSLIHQFNNLIVEIGDSMAEVSLQPMLNMFSTFKTAKLGDIVYIDYPENNLKTRLIWSATSTGVDLVRVSPTKTSDIAQPKDFSTGVYYEPMDFTNGNIENFNKVVNRIAEAKVKLYYEIIRDLITAAIAASTIPANNVLEGDNLTLAQYRKVAQIFQRYGGTPVFSADLLLIQYFAEQQTTDAFYKEILTEKLKTDLLEQLVPQKIANTVAVPIYNLFTDRNNNAVEFDITEGFMFASAGVKPFSIVEFGGLRQFTGQHMADERIKMKLSQRADVRLLAAWLIGKITENTAVALT